MKGSLPWVLLGSVFVLVCLVPVVVQAQGFLVVTDADHVVRLPRPIIIYPPPYPPHPHPPSDPVPPPPPPASYKIKELEVQARLVDQVAQVQVSQSFVNTGSRQMEVAFVFPLPYDGAIDQMTLLVDGKEYPGQAAGGRGGPAALRGHRPQEPATRPCWNGWARACSRPACFRCRRGRSGRSRSATRSSAASRKG